MGKTSSKEEKFSSKQVAIKIIKSDPISTNVSILAIGISRYDYLPTLPGPIIDLNTIENIFTSDSRISIYDKSNFKKLENPSSTQVRIAINEYVNSLSADGDILIFYFSGHGANLYHDFGFCCRDTNAHQESGLSMPLSLIRFSDIIMTLSLKKVTPVFIIDACYSGQAARSHPPLAAIEALKKDLQMETGSQYALICACDDRTTAGDTVTGGVFTNAFAQALRKGSRKNRASPFLSLKDLENHITTEITNSAIDASPRFFLGNTLPMFPLVKNIHYSRRTERFRPCFHQIISMLWNDGNPVERKIGDFGDAFGPDAYGNHSKLSYIPWALVEKGSSSSHRKLTAKGKKFAQGKCHVCPMIWKDEMEDVWKNDVSSGKIRINTPSK